MKVLVVGYQKSGKSASRLLKKLGYKVVIVHDDRMLDTQKIDRLIADLSFIVVSPGVNQDSLLLSEAKKHNIKIIGELELGYQNLKGKLIAITGTNGKTTTTSLIAHLLGNNNIFVGGNIGTPLSQVCEQTNSHSTTVCEVSSFQLCSIDRFCPHIAVLLNITADHLNYHKTMQNYLNAKLNIFKNQTQNHVAVINADDTVVSQVKIQKSKVLYFSTKKQVNGCFIKNGNIYFKDTTKAIKGFVIAKKIAKVKDINLLGEHNLSNSLAAIVCALLSGVKPADIACRLKSFKPVKHRLEHVTDINGIEFINDSKATNVLSTLCAINSINRPATLILGGSDKGCQFDEIFMQTSTIVNYVLIGQTKNLLAQAADRHGCKNYVFAENLSSAVQIAYKQTPTGGVVLFSPACASFDMFANFEQRGKCFCGIVRELKKSENNRSKNFKKTKS